MPRDDLERTFREVLGEAHERPLGLPLVSESVFLKAHRLSLGRSCLGVSIIESPEPPSRCEGCGAPGECGRTSCRYCDRAYGLGGTGGHSAVYGPCSPRY